MLNFKKEQNIVSYNVLGSDHFLKSILILTKIHKICNAVCRAGLYHATSITGKART